jgi:lactate permease
MVGRQTPLLALVVPLILVGMVDGWRGVRQTWPAALTGGLMFGVLQFATSNYISVELTDIVASLGSAAAVVALLRVWQPAEPVRSRFSGPRPAIAGASTHAPALEADVRRRERDGDPPLEVARAYAPYLIIIAVFGIAQIGAVHDWLSNATRTFSWPGLHVLNSKGAAPKSLTFKFDYLQAAGTLMLVSGLLTMAVLKVNPLRALRIYAGTLNQLKWAIVTVMSVLSLAYVMTLSGQTITLGTWAAGAGSFFAFLSPVIGWLGTAVTGSDTSSNSLFGVLQVTAGKKAHIDPLLLAASNSSGGVVGKMISPQNLAIGAAAVGMSGQEGELFRKVVGWSLLLLLLLAVLVLLQSVAALSWMVV